MANKPVAGSWGRVKVIKVAPDLTTSTYTWSGTTVALWGAGAWKSNQSVSGGVPEIGHFENTADTEGRLYKQLIKGGMADSPVIDIEGISDIDATGGTQIILPFGCAVKMDLLFWKAGPSGYIGVLGVVESYQDGGKVDDKSFAYTLKVKIQNSLNSYLSLV